MLQDINEISDGKIYGVHDMVRVGCSDCAGCHSCCEQMGDTVLVDPYDCKRLETELGMNFEQLMQSYVGLHVEEGLIVPHLKMQEQTDTCVFLNEAGRCSIHAYRPGICRLFPLGRIYEEQGISYFLQSGACERGKTKIKVEKWLDTPQLKRYQQFLTEWHSLKKNMQEYLSRLNTEDEKKTVCMMFLQIFFFHPYDSGRDFYEEWEERSSLKPQLAISREVLENPARHKLENKSDV